MRTAKDLSREELETVVTTIHEMVFLTEGRWDTDSQVNGGDLLDAVIWQLELVGLKPDRVDT